MNVDRLLEPSTGQDVRLTFCYTQPTGAVFASICRPQSLQCRVLLELQHVRCFVAKQKSDHFCPSRDLWANEAPQGLTTNVDRVIQCCVEDRSLRDPELHAAEIAASGHPRKLRANTFVAQAWVLIRQ